MSFVPSSKRIRVLTSTITNVKAQLKTDFYKKEYERVQKIFPTKDNVINKLKVAAAKEIISIQEEEEIEILIPDDIYKELIEYCGYTYYDNDKKWYYDANSFDKISINISNGDSIRDYDEEMILFNSTGNTLNDEGSILYWSTKPNKVFDQMNVNYRLQTFRLLEDLGLCKAVNIKLDILGNGDDTILGKNNVLQQFQIGVVSWSHCLQEPYSHKYDFEFDPDAFKLTGGLEYLAPSHASNGVVPFAGFECNRNENTEYIVSSRHFYCTQQWSKSFTQIPPISVEVEIYKKLIGIGISFTGGKGKIEHFYEFKQQNFYYYFTFKMPTNMGYFAVANIIRKK